MSTKFVKCKTCHYDFPEDLILQAKGDFKEPDKLGIPLVGSCPICWKLTLSLQGIPVQGRRFLALVGDAEEFLRRTKQLEVSAAQNKMYRIVGCQLCSREFPSMLIQPASTYSKNLRLPDVPACPICWESAILRIRSKIEPQALAVYRDLAQMARSWLSSGGVDERVSG